MCSAYPGRRFSCLVEVLLSLFLSAPISLHAQSASCAVAAGTIRAAAPNAIATAEYASLLRRSSHFETRPTAGSASLS